jgi:hypothetical protein
MKAETLHAKLELRVQASHRLGTVGHKAKQAHTYQQDTRERPSGIPAPYHMLAARARIKWQSRVSTSTPPTNHVQPKTTDDCFCIVGSKEMHLRQIRHDPRDKQNMSIVDWADVDENQIGVWPHCGSFRVRGLLPALQLVQHLLLQSLAEVELRRVKWLHHLQDVLANLYFELLQHLLQIPRRTSAMSTDCKFETVEQCTTMLGGCLDRLVSDHMS